MATIAWVAGLWIVGSMLLALVIGTLLRRFSELSDGNVAEVGADRAVGVEPLGSPATAA